jgi:hypothetical protein
MLQQQQLTKIEYKKQENNFSVLLLIISYQKEKKTTKQDKNRSHFFPLNKVSIHISIFLFYQFHPRINYYQHLMCFWRSATNIIYYYIIIAKKRIYVGKKLTCTLCMK